MASFPLFIFLFYIGNISSLSSVILFSPQIKIRRKNYNHCVNKNFVKQICYAFEINGPIESISQMKKDETVSHINGISHYIHANFLYTAGAHSIIKVALQQAVLHRQVLKSYRVRAMLNNTAANPLVEKALTFCRCLQFKWHSGFLLNGCN